jgi:hypothetical protein
MLIIVISLGALLGFLWILWCIFSTGAVIYGITSGLQGRGPLGQVASEHHRLSDALKTIANPDEARQLIEASTLPSRNKKMVWAVWERQQTSRG